MQRSIQFAALPESHFQRGHQWLHGHPISPIGLTPSATGLTRPAPYSRPQIKAASEVAKVIDTPLGGAPFDCQIASRHTTDNRWMAILSLAIVFTPWRIAWAARRMRKC
jgi:hypothetical protein